MPITPYLRPQDTITQILRSTPTPAVARRNPVVIGPQYFLQLNDGRELNKTVFNSLGVVDYGYKLANGDALSLDTYLPHVSSVELFGENLEAEVGSIAATASANENAVMRYGATNDTLTSGSHSTAKNFKGAPLIAGLDSRGVKVGDTLAVSLTGITGTVRRTVTALLPRMSDPTGTSGVASTNLAGAASLLVQLASGSNANYSFATTTSAVAAVGSFLTFGGGFAPNSAAGKRLGETFVITAANSAAGIAAQFTVTALASGQSRAITTSVFAGGVYTIPLDLVGYTGVTISVTRGANVVIGEQITVKLFPVYVPVTSAGITVTNASSYTPTVSRQYIVEVTAATVAGSVPTSTFRVYEASGAENIQTGITGVVAGTTQVALGTSGVTVTLAAGVLYKGHKFTVAMTAGAASATEFSGVKLSGPILDLESYTGQTVAVKVYQAYTGQLTSDNVATGTALTATALTTSYAAALGLRETATGRATISISPFESGIGHVFLSYKAVVIPGELESVINITSAADMTSQVGEAHLDNWLGRGVFEAFNGNQKQRVYALRTLGDTVEDFADALRKIRSTDVYYALAVMTDNLDVKKLVVAHCEEMSNKFNKNFRRCYVGTDSPGKYTAWGIKASGGYRLGSVASKIFTIESEDRVYGSFAAEDLGSYINIPSEGEFVITQVYNAYEVQLACPIALAVSNIAFSLVRSDTAGNTIRFLSETAASLSSRRCVNVWSDRASTITSRGSEVIPNKFVAAEVAGLRCALLPQQGLTMTEIASVVSAPAMYTRFTPEQLDTIASYGNLIVTQEAAGGEIFIRHQLTTNTDAGALAYEDNVGVVVDEFSFRVKDTFRSYIGKRNATQATLSEIRNKLYDLVTAATLVSIAQRDIGSMIITFFNEAGEEGAVTARLDGVLADHILTYVKLRVALPLNGIDHYIDVETSIDL